MEQTDPSIALKELKKHNKPYFIGVRHHSVVMSRVIPQLLDSYKPEKILLELPSNFQEWINWLGHPDTRAPIALSAVNHNNHSTSFYPFADFSPELATIRWAHANQIEVIACDLDIRAREYQNEERFENTKGLLKQLGKVLHSSDHEPLWDQLVESKGLSEFPEAVRAAALLFGWTLRNDTQSISQLDLLRESCMREAITKHEDDRCVIVAGAFHIPAFLEGDTIKPHDSIAYDHEVSCSIFPYRFSHFDERSGYPAGIKDPSWQQGLWESHSIPDINTFLNTCIIKIFRDMRELGFLASTAEATEALRFCHDLKTLRGLPYPGRRELLESLQSTLARGQTIGECRNLVNSLEKILIGHRQGSLAQACPTLGLSKDIQSLFEKLKLPDQKTSLKEKKEIRLDPLRSTLDRSRSIFLNRLSILLIPYGEKRSSGFSDTLTEVWQLQWNEKCNAMLSHAEVYGASLTQAVTGYLNFTYQKNEKAEYFSPEDKINFIDTAAHAGIISLTEKWLSELYTGDLLSEFKMKDYLALLNLLEKIYHHHIPGLITGTDNDKKVSLHQFTIPDHINQQDIIKNILSLMEGYIQSNEINDAKHLIELWHWINRQDKKPGLSKWFWILNEMLDHGSHLMKGAALMLLYFADRYKNPGKLIASYIDSANTSEMRTALKHFLSGTIAMTDESISVDSEIISSINERLDFLNDEDFLSRLLALRSSFDIFSPAARVRILKDIIINIDEDHDRSTDLQVDVNHVKMLAEIDHNTQDLVKQFIDITFEKQTISQTNETSDIQKQFQNSNLHSISLIERWKLILGQKLKKNECASKSIRAGLMLDDLYGSGQGEGSSSYHQEDGGGTDAPQLQIREWVNEINQIWNAEVCEEVKAEAAIHGRHAATLELSAEHVTPSIELLETILSLKGSVPESKLELLRNLVDQLLNKLIAILANKMTPALRGLLNHTPSRRHSPKIHLKRTIESNLKTCYQVNDEWKIIPEKIYFKQAMEKQIDWHLSLVVDVSASMEASVIHSAMMAAVFSKLPCLSVQFYAFSTEVIDFTHRVDDPLSLLIEIEVGGGTNIGLGLATARKKMKVPSRTLVVLVSDFEEGCSVNRLINEVSLLSESGATLLGLASLNAQGQPRYHKGMANKVVAAGMPVAALSPNELAHWVKEQIN